VGPAPRTILALLAALGPALAAPGPARAQGPGAPADTAGPGARTYSTAAQGATLTLEQSIDPAGPITVAQRVRLSLRATATPGWKIELPAPGAALGDWSVASAVPAQRPESPETATLTIVLEPFLAGSKTIPAITVSARSGAKTLSVKTEPITVEVKPVAEPTATEKTALEPPHEPVPVPLPDREAQRRRLQIAAIAAGTVVLLGLGVVGVRRMTARRARDHARAAREALPPIRARIEAGEVAPALNALATTLRAYAQNHLGLPAIGRTAAELHMLHPASLGEAAWTELVAILGVLDTARFAPYPTGPTQAAALVDRAAAFIDATADLQPGPDAPPAKEAA
jgi:hypothetical protein